MRFAWLTLGLGTASFLALAHCGSDDSCADTATCTTAGDSGVPEGGATDGTTEADAPVAVTPPGCDDAADAKDSLACQVDSFAIFVDPNGNDDSDGSKAHPVKSINTGIAKADAGPVRKTRLYICGSDPFAEHVKLTGAQAPNLFGGFACGTWAVSGDKPKVLPGDVGYALQIDTVTTALRVEDMSFEARAGTADARSSIAVFAASSPSVTMKRVEVKANAGADGKDALAGDAGALVSGTPDGTPAAAAAGGAAKVCTCTSGGSSTGGAGGDTLGAFVNGMPGLPSISPSLPDPSFSGAGQTQADCNAGVSPARAGSNAPAAVNATPPPVGSLTKAGWQPGDGSAGGNGSPGQGGGGGGSRTNLAVANDGAGSGGGCGGCGGFGGGGGLAGGASVALLSLDSAITVMDSNLESGAGGKAGHGGDGGAGTAGGSPGAVFHAGCPGNAGGLGGKGGAGAGGSGGISAAILYKGDKPSTQGGTLTPGAKGTFGIGGATPANDGPDGQSAATLAAP